MYQSLSVESLPLKDETSPLDNSHQSSGDIGDWVQDMLSRPKVKLAIGIAFVVVIAFVGVANNHTQTTGSQASTVAYLEVQDDGHIEPGKKVLTKFAIQGVVSQAYITHSSEFWEVNSNIGILGTSRFTTEEQWDVGYLDDQFGQYYKLVHSHDHHHWLFMLGVSSDPRYSFNPTVTHSERGIYDKNNTGIRWDIVTNADGSGAMTDAFPTGAGTVYYLVNRKRNRCLAVMTALANPQNAGWDALQNSVTSFAADEVSKEFPASCKIQFIDATNAPQPPNGPAFLSWWR